MDLYYYSNNTFFINILNMINSNVLYNPEESFSYLGDVSNSLVQSVLFFLSYFLLSYYPNKFSEWQKIAIGKNDSNTINKSMKRHIIITAVIVLVLAIGFGLTFYGKAAENETAFWIRGLSKFGRVYYCFMLSITWYHSLILLGMILTSGYVIYWCIDEKKLVYILEEYKENISVILSFDLLIMNFSYGLFYIGGAIIFIIVDHDMKKNDIINTFSDDTASLILLLIISLLVSIAYIPLQKLLKYMKKNKMEYIEYLDQQIEKEKKQSERIKIVEKKAEVITHSCVYTSFQNRLILFSSVGVPLLGIILQLFDI